jgi:hypothetical protein
MPELVVSNNVLGIGAVLLFPFVLMAGAYAGIDYSRGAIIAIIIAFLIGLRFLANRNKHKP